MNQEAPFAHFADPETRKIVEEAHQRLGTFARSERRYRLLHLADLMATQRLTASDLSMMLRGQILGVDWQHVACEEDRLYLQMEFGRIPPGKVPPASLMCPLVERAFGGDEKVPCYMAQDDAEERRYEILERGARTPLEAIIRQELHACVVVGKVMVPAVGLIIGRSDCEPQEGIEEEREQRLLAQRDELLRAGPVETHEARRAQVQFLVDSGRLTRVDVMDLGERRLVATEPGWLSCRDDARHKFFPPADHTPEEMRDPSTWRCPLHERALLGDRTVPCAEALRAPQDPTLVEEARRTYPRGRRPPDLPRSWHGEEDRPGAPQDPVLMLEMHPCQLIGALLDRELHPRLEELAAAVGAWEDEDDEDNEEASRQAIEEEWISP